MKKVLAFCLLVSLLAVSCAAPAGGASSAAPPESSGPAPSQSQSEPPPADYAPNKALEATGLLGSIDDEILAAVRIFYHEPTQQELAATVESYEQGYGAYLYVVPRYAGSELVIESMVFDEARSVFLPDRELFTATAGDDYALLLRADLPEGGPQLRVTIRYDGQEAVYEPTYDGRGDTVYPVKKGRILLDEAPLRAMFTDGTKQTVPTQLGIGDRFLGWTLRDMAKFVDGRPWSITFEGEATLRGSLRMEPKGGEGAMMGGVAQFQVAEESLHLMPYAVDDTRTLWFGLNNSEEAKAALGITEGENYDCEIVIRNYHITLMPSAVWNSATFVSGKVL